MALVLGGDGLKFTIWWLSQHTNGTTNLDIKHNVSETELTNMLHLHSPQPPSSPMRHRTQQVLGTATAGYRGTSNEGCDMFVEIIVYDKNHYCNIQSNYCNIQSNYCNIQNNYCNIQNNYCNIRSVAVACD